MEERCASLPLELRSQALDELHVVRTYAGLLHEIH
jgi:hypothetical protein